MFASEESIFGDIQQQSLFKLFMEHAPAAIAMLDLDMHYLVVSKRWYEDYQLPESEVIGFSHYDLFPDIPQRWKDIHQECLKGKSASKRKDNFLRDDGTEVWLNWQIQPWYISKGVVGGIIMFTEVITDLVLAEREKEQAHQLFLSVMEAASDMICILDAEGNFLFLNHQLNGESGADIIGKNIYHHLSPEEGKIIWETLKKARESREIQRFQNSYRKGDKGPVYWFDNTLTPITGRGGIKDHFVLFSHNITKLVSAHEQITESEKHLRTIYDSTSDFISIIDLEGRFMYINRTIPSFKPAELIGQYFWEFSEAEIAQKMQDSFFKALDSGNNVTFENHRQLESGMVLFFRSTIKPVKSESGEIEHVVIFTQDITEIRAAQVFLEKMNAELEERVESRTLQLKEINEETRHFAYIVSHDLRVPLVNVKGFASEIDQSLSELRQTLFPYLSLLPDHDKEEIRYLLEKDLPESLSYIRSAGKRMGELIDAILKLSRLGSKPINWEEIDTQSLVEDALQHFKHQLDNADAKVRIVSLPPVWADREMLSQIVSNLIDNAIKYRSPARPLELTITGQKTAKRVMLDFTDNGRGIDKKDFKQIFHLFRRSGISEVAGEGIGLTYVKSLINRLEGRIKVESELGEGTNFRLALNQPPEPENIIPAV